jgi:hypothetical protein
MKPDNAKELASEKFMKKIRGAETVICPIEAYRPNQNQQSMS